MAKTPEYMKKADLAYKKRNGYVMYTRRVKPHWKAELDKLLNELRKKDSHQNS